MFWKQILIRQAAEYYQVDQSLFNQKPNLPALVHALCYNFNMKVEMKLDT
jgi:hypothetical protein